MNLLERDHCFEQLSILYRTATTGNGRTVLVSGEAGIGKTALVEQFVSLHCRAVRRLWGACEALFTPRPLGPLYDIAAQVHGSLSTLMSRDTPRPMVFSALLDELQKSASPTVVGYWRSARQSRHTPEARPPFRASGHAPGPPEASIRRTALYHHGWEPLLCHRGPGQRHPRHPHDGA